MVDRQFSDARLAALYDALQPPEQRTDFAFYLPLIMASERVLDVGCGTGALLRLARDRGHEGRLVGLDPGAGMLEQARTCADIEWVLGDLTSVTWDAAFDLVVMTGHAFQVLLDDAEIERALRAIRRALASGGRFAFETRNPTARAWESWTPANGVDFVAADGVPVRWESDVQEVTADRVRFLTTFSSPTWDAPDHSESTLRFLDAAGVSRFLEAADLDAAERYGDFDRSPMTATSPEIITIATRVGDAAST
jgi:SAM-dependent methyltransferase